MTTSSSLSIATSSLRAIQTQMAIASANIANADDVNYTKKTANQASVVTGGVGAGVEVTSITSNVNENLIRSIVAAMSGNAAAQTTESYLSSLNDTLGTLYSDSDGETMSTHLSDLESALNELAATPESESLKNEVVADLDDSLNSLQEASDDVQNLRSQADTEIESAVDTVNDALQQIDDLNKSIAKAQAAGDSTADLEDQRNAALETVSEQIGVNYYVNDNGSMYVYTESGQILVGSQVHELSFTASTDDITNSDSYPSTLSGVTVDGVDITNSLTTGNIGALITLRDETLPGVQADLDTLAKNLKDTLNEIANSGSASPPPSSLVGTEMVSSTDPLSASGTLTISITDSDGKVTGTDTFDLSDYATVGELTDALNAAGLGMTASIDTEGHLNLKATDSTGGVAVSGGSIGGENFSGYFGLNDLIVGDNASEIAVNPTLAADTSRFPTGTLDTTAAIGEEAVSSGSGSLAQSLADAMLSADFSSQAGDIVSDVGAKLSSATTRASSNETSLNTLTSSFSSAYGVNVDEETAQISELQNAYAASAQILSAVQSMFDDLLNAVG